MRLGRELKTRHRRRLVRLGVPETDLDALGLREIEGDDLPAWWAAGANSMYVAAGLAIPMPRLKDALATAREPALIVVAEDVSTMAWARVHGPRATIYLGPGTHLTGSTLDCGGRSQVILLRATTATARARIDARNGGSILLAHPDQLWASDVTVTTDDMHRITDVATSDRLNPFGCRIVLREHVWLGQEVVVSGNTEIARDCVVGLRSLVRNTTTEAGTILAGTPARVVRRGITWTPEDTP